VPYQSLDPSRIIDTVAMLRQRIGERFPDSGLSKVAEVLGDLAIKARDSTDEITRPILGLRIATGLLVALIVVGLIGTAVSLADASGPSLTAVEFIQALEAGINDLVLIGVGVFFLVSLERRIKRGKILRAIHELRSIAHVVDMHQLTKDPGHALRTSDNTPSSPRRRLDHVSLERYLDYCSEMLSLTGKIAALYVEEFDDNVVLASVNEVEGLTTGLSNKIWQKMMILEGLSGEAAST
jgi:hypothetical protein